MADEKNESEGTSIDGWKSFLEALKDANTSTPDLPGDKLVAAPLTYEAIEDAAAELAQAFGTLILDGTRRILVTSNPDLVSACATYVEVDAAVSSLDTAADAVLKAEASKSQAQELVEATAVGAGLAAIAGLVPPLLSLLSPKLTVRMSKVEANDLAAAAAVVAALSKGTATAFIHDTFRSMRKESGLLSRVNELNLKRARLVAKKLRAPDGTDTSAIDALLTTIDEFTAALRTVPSGGNRSLLSTALLAAPLYADGKEKITHALYVKSEGGHSLQTIDDRPFIFNDKVSVFTEVAISFLFIDVESDEIKAAATVSGKAHGFGTIGAELTITRPNAALSARTRWS